jgi:OOP family OmpA-OmpF porin
VLSTPAAFAEQQMRGFYFGVWGGSGSIDMASREAFDAVIIPTIGPDLVASGPFLSDADTTVILSLNNIDPDSSEVDDTVSVWGAQIGYRWNNYFAAEIGYANLGEVSYRILGEGHAIIIDRGVPDEFDFRFQRASKFTSQGPTASVIGLLPLGPVDVQGRAGLYFADTRLTNHIRDIDDPFNVAHRRVDGGQTELLAGIGATWNATENLSVRVEYQRFFDVGDDEKTGESDVDVFNIGVLFR